MALFTSGWRPSLPRELEVVARNGSGASVHPPLLFVHGCWAEHFLEFFADRGFDAYALSLRGPGGSGGREQLRWTSVADCADDALPAWLAATVA